MIQVATVGFCFRLATSRGPQEAEQAVAPNPLHCRLLRNQRPPFAVRRTKTFCLRNDPRRNHRSVSRRSSASSRKALQWHSCPSINLIAAGIEAVIGIFVSGFSLGRIERKKGERNSTASAVGGIITLLIIVGLIGWFVVAPKVMNRKVTLVAEDGHSLPFAALIIHHRRRRPASADGQRGEHCYSSVRHGPLSQ
jgi:hypothetical protein